MIGTPLAMTTATPLSPSCMALGWMRGSTAARVATNHPSLFLNIFCLPFPSTPTSESEKPSSQLQATIGTLAPRKCLAISGQT